MRSKGAFRGDSSLEGAHREGHEVGIESYLRAVGARAAR